ncbi:MAG: TRAP transporter fused permease subunit [Deltaproteobacteria bacterium]|nr:TRAP transporter fused permease subunit [Deltaproteobacteria bacterium]
MTEKQKGPPKNIRYDSLPLPVKIYVNVATFVGVAIGIYFIFGLNIGGLLFVDAEYYYLFFGLFGPCGFLIMPEQKKASWYDYLLSTLFFALCIYFFLNARQITLVGWIPATQFNVVLACIFIVIMLEGARRGAGGLAWPIVALVLGIYPLIADYVPGVFNGVSQPFNSTISYYVYGGFGILGIPGRVMGGILLGFLVFAGFLIETGAGKFFLDVAYSLLGKYRGGPAKVAVVSSGFFGSLSGSIAANIVSTGSITIPAMKRLGYPARYAGALEACASTGGVLMPPVMGATAFVMAAMLETPYHTIMLAAAVPSILFYFGLLVQADAYAAKVGMKGLPKEELPSFWRVLKKGWPFLFVLLFLVWGLLIMEWEFLTPFYASLVLILLSFTSSETRITSKNFFNAMLMVGTLVTRTLVIILPAGIVISAISITGVGAAFTTGAVSLGGGNLVLIMIIGVLACYVMGMAGMLLTAYVFLAVTMAPAIIQIGGLNELSVHLFIMYYSMLSFITPPVAAGAFIGAAVAGASPIKTAITAMRLGIVIYFVPFFFVFNPALILQGPLFESLYLFIFCLIGIWVLAGGLEGYLAFVGRLALWTRPILIGGGFMIALPGIRSTIIGAVISAVIIYIILIMNKLRFKEDQISMNT